MKSLVAQRGLTLIEVLIALAIISIAMTAVIKATSQNIHSTHYLEQKTIAMWVSENVMNEARAHLLKEERSSHHQKLTKEMLGQTWYYQTEQEETPNPRIIKMTVKVYENEDAEENATPLIELEGYIYHEA